MPAGSGACHYLWACLARGCADLWLGVVAETAGGFAKAYELATLDRGEVVCKRPWSRQLLAVLGRDDRAGGQRYGRWRRAVCVSLTQNQTVAKCGYLCRL